MLPDQAESKKRQQVLADFGEFAISSDNLDEVLTEACRLVAEALGTGRAKVLEIQEDRQELLVRAGVGWAPDVVGTVRLQMSDRSSETYAIRAAEPIVSQDVATETRFDIPAFMKAAGVVALVNAPIFVPGKRPYGLLQVDATTPRDFGDEDVQFLRTYAIILGPVIDRLHLLEERRSVRERVEASEARHRLLVESWAQAVWEVDANGVVVADSPSWRAYTGQTLQEWFDYGWLNAIHPDDRADAEQQWRDAIADRTNLDAESRLRAPDGGWRWTNVRAAAVFDADGHVASWVGMNIDIDPRKRAERTVRAREADLVRVQRIGRVGGLDIDVANGLVSRRSPEYLRLHGLGLESLHETHADWRARVHPDDVDEAERHLFEALAGTGSVYESNYRIIRPSDGAIRWIAARADIELDDSGRAVRMVGAHLDVTDQRESETALRESDAMRRVALSSGGMGSWRWDRIANSIRGDAQFFALWGVPEADEPLPLEAFTARMSPAGAQEMADVVAQALAANEEFSGPLEIASGPRAGRWVQWQGRAAEDDPSVLYGVTFDVTDRRAAEAEARQSEERQAFLLKLSDALRPLADPADIQGATTRLLREQLNTGWCYYVDWDLNKNIGLVLRDSTGDGLPSLAGEHDVSDAPEFLDLLEIGETLTIRDYAGYEQLPAGTRQKFVALGFRSMMIAPLVKEERLIATLLVGDTKIRDWTAQEASLLVEAGERTWAAVERLRVEAALRDSEKALAADLANAERLRSLSERLVPSEGLQPIYDEVLSATVAITRADAGTVQIYDPATKSLDLIASLNFSRTITDYFDRVDAGSRTACGIALKTGECAFADFPEEVADVGCQLLVGEGIQSAVAYPLMSRAGTPLGMLNAHWRRAGHRPNEREMRFLGLLARQAADLIEQRRNQSALRESEERQRALIEGVPQLVWRASDVGDWTWASPQWTNFTGQTAEDSRGWGWLGTVHPNDREAVRAAWSHAPEREQFDADYRICAQETGVYRWFHARATPIRNEAGQIVEWLGTSNDVNDLRRLKDRQDILLAELQHRVRNILAVTRSIISRSDDGERTTEDYVAHLQGRISALARTQVLLTQTAGTNVDLELLIRDELLAQVASEDQIDLTGEDVSISPKSAEVLTLAIHELATNATKYGAFTRSSGRLRVSWQVEERGNQNWLVILWQERGVPIVDAVPRRQGFGSELIRRRIPYELKGYGSVDLKPGGLESRIEFPLADGESILQTDAGGR